MVKFWAFLEIFNPATNGSTMVEITVKTHLRDWVGLADSELMDRAEDAAGGKG